MPRPIDHQSLRILKQLALKIHCVTCVKLSSVASFSCLPRPRQHPRNLRSLCFIKPGKSKPRAAAKGASLRSDSKQPSSLQRAANLASALLKQALQVSHFTGGGCPHWNGAAAIGVEGSFASHPIESSEGGCFLKGKGPR